MSQRRIRLSGLGSGQGATVAEAMERLTAIDETLTQAFEHARPQIEDFEARHRALCSRLHAWRKTAIDWREWAFSTLSYHPGEGAYFSASEAGNILDNLEQAIWALQRPGLERWKWFCLALHGAAHGLLLEVLRQAGVEVAHAGGPEKGPMPFGEALSRLAQPGLLAPEPAGWLGGDPQEAQAQRQALNALDEAHQHSFSQVLPSLARPLRIVEFVDQVASRCLAALAELALEHYHAWSIEQRLGVLGCLSRLNDLLLLEFGRLHGETRQILCRAHYAGVPLQNRRRG